jgi:ATP-dependent Clp protease adapter protein ClpS
MITRSRKTSAGPPVVRSTASLLLSAAALLGAFSSTMFNTVGTVTNSSLPEAGANVTSPVNGTLVRWRITQATGGPFKLRVLTPDGGTTYTGAGSGALQTPSSLATQTFPANLPINAGQTIGIDNSLGSDHVGVASVAGASFQAWVPPLVDGQTRAATSSGAAEVGFNADVQPFPSVSTVSPSSGATSGGTTVTISGQNFEGATAVSFGSTPAASFTVLSDNVLTAVTRPSSAGTVDVTVRNPGQSPTTAADRFTFANVVKCVVPKLKGKTLKKARKALKKAHCKLGKVKGPKGKKARIKKQKPKAGKVLKAGSKVKVTTKRR